MEDAAKRFLDLLRQMDVDRNSQSSVEEFKNAFEHVSFIMFDGVSRCIYQLQVITVKLLFTKAHIVKLKRTLFISACLIYKSIVDG